MRTYPMLCILIATLFQCCSPRQEYAFQSLHPELLETQFFTITIGTDTTVTTASGISIRLCGSTFEGMPGDTLQLRVKEVRKAQQLLTSGIPTMTSDGRLLQSVAMLQITTIPEHTISPACPIQVAVPKSARLPSGAWLFTANIDHGQVLWQPEYPLPEPKPTLAESNGQQLFTTLCTPCHSATLTENYTGPALNCVTEFYPREWLVKFTRNPTKLINAADSFALCVWNRYKPMLMPAFDTLTDQQINDIYDYIESVRDINFDCEPLRYTDSECATAYIAAGFFSRGTAFDYSSYQFPVQDFQWYNVDIFLSGNLTEGFVVQFNTKQPVEAYLFSNFRNILLPLEKRNNRYFIVNFETNQPVPLPIGETIHIIGFTTTLPRQVVVKEVVIQKKNEYTLDMLTVSELEFMNWLNTW